MVCLRRFSLLHHLIFTSLLSLCCGLPAQPFLWSVAGQRPSIHDIEDEPASDMAMSVPVPLLLPQSLQQQGLQGTSTTLHLESPQAISFVVLLSCFVLSLWRAEGTRVKLLRFQQWKLEGG